MQKSDIIIVLARPEEPGNVGAVCRAMKNMGLSRLRLVSPQLIGGRAEEVVRARAVHAADVWDRAEIFTGLPEAVADCSIVIGTTRRRGRRRKQVSMTPRELAANPAARPGPAALVFGNEKTGLEDYELELCGLASHIPVDDEFPSLNLSHAVQIYAYEIFTAMTTADASGSGAVKGQWIPLNREGVEKCVDGIIANLRRLGFYTQRGPEEQIAFFRDLYSRAALTEKEGRYFAGLIAKAARLGEKKNRRPPW